MLIMMMMIMMTTTDDNDIKISTSVSLDTSRRILATGSQAPNFLKGLWEPRYTFHHHHTYINRIRIAYLDEFSSQFSLRVCTTAL